jgi:hypothetical protein
MVHLSSSSHTAGSLAEPIDRHLGRFNERMIPVASTPKWGERNGKKDEPLVAKKSFSGGA